MKDEDRDERGGREASAGAPASPAPGLSPPAGHPAFETGVLYVEPELRDEVQAYWQAYATWERTRQGPPPQAPRVSVRVDHDEKPSAAAQLRDAMAPMGAARGGRAKSAGGKSAGEKSAGEKSAGTSPWAADEAAVIDKSALPSAHRPRNEAAEKNDETGARPGKARRAGTVAAMLALAAGIGAAAMCGAKERAPAEGAAARGTMGDAAASGAAASGAAASGATSGAAASEVSAPAPVAESAPVGASPEAAVERVGPAAVPDRAGAVGSAHRRPTPATHAPAPRTPEAQAPKRQPSPEDEPEAPAAPVASAPAPVAPAPATVPSPAARGAEPPPTSEPHIFQPKLKY